MAETPQSRQRLY